MQTELRVLSFALACAAATTTHAQSSSPFERSVTGSEGFWQRYTLEIPAGTASLDVTLSEGSGDPDLYVRFGEEPSASSYDCRSNSNGTAEQCSIPTPRAGVWHIAVLGYTSFNDVAVKASWAAAAAAPATDWKTEVLDRHNVVRAQHCSQPLTWDASLEASAQQYANQCIWDHDASNTTLGENMAYRALNTSALSTIDSWYAESAKYDYAQPGFISGTGHFTQVVWSATTRIGCARTQCPLSTLLKNPNEKDDAYLYICRYAESGNITNNYPQNVKPKSESGLCE